MNRSFSIKQSDEMVSGNCAICGCPVRWAAGPHLHVEQQAPGVVCRDCGRQYAQQLAQLLEGIESYPGERQDLAQKREQCMNLLASLSGLQHGDPGNLPFLRAVGALVDAMPNQQIARAVDAAWQSNPAAANKARLMQKPAERARRQ